MKIAYDSQIFCSQTYGGISRYFCEIASRIAQAPGVEVAITAPMHINTYLKHLPKGIVSGFRASKTDHYKSPYPLWVTRGIGSLAGDWMLRTMRPDVVHETYFSPYRLGGLRARRVLTIYDMIHEKFASSFPRSDKTARYKALAADRADHVIYISESTRRDATEILGVPPEKTSVIHLGFDLMRTAEAFAETDRLPASEPFLLYVGDRHGYKNFSRLLEAYAVSPFLKTEFHLICFGGGAFRPGEVDMLKKLNLHGGKVRQIGGNDQLLAKLYEGASAFVYPSLYEGFGIPPLEAMAHDCPVVCSNTSSIPEVVGDAGEYFDPVDIESMRAAIELVVGSAASRAYLIEKGRLRLQAFSWDRCATETLAIYKNLS